MKSEARRNAALLTDFYELTMMQGYFLHQHNPSSVFEMLFRRPPFNGGFTVFAGLQTLLDGIENLSFDRDDLDFLDAQGIFRSEFLAYLEDFRFSGDIYAMDEGSLVFPDEPLIQVKAPLIEAHLIESFLLNTINFQTLIATKAARVVQASRQGLVLEFGLRRAPGADGALSASRAAYLGGVSATSNTLAAKLFDIPARGTMAHSWVMAFDSELEAFERFAEIYPEDCILLIDTYDTLDSGLVHAIQIGKRLQRQGNKNFGVRLDSGDLEYLSKEVRRRLDEAGLEDAIIAASNELDEKIIHQLVTEQAPIDLWGVGTSIVTARDDPALSGVYKLIGKETEEGFVPAIKVSNNPEKITNPGVKQVYRFFGKQDSPLADLLALEDERITTGTPHRFFHPKYPYRFFDVGDYERIEPLLSLKMKEGRLAGALPALHEVRTRVRQGLEQLDHTYRRIINPHVYKVSLSGALKDLKYRLIERYTGREGKLSP